MSGSKYQTHVEQKLPWITKMARDGLTDKDIASNLGVAESTFCGYKKEHPELLEALMEGKVVADAKVESALYRRALGYEFIETTKELVDGEMVAFKQVTKQIAGDVTAQIFWLKNRLPGEWRDVKQIDHEGSLEINNPLANLTEEELRKLIEVGDG